MVPGYDGGLYHVPYQSWLKDYEILIGFSDLNFRFALGSIYNYVAALLWHDEIFIFVSYFSTIFYLIFFLFLKEFLLENKKKVFFCFLILFTSPLWSRYIYPSYALVDAPFGLISIIFLTFFFFKLEIWIKEGITQKDLLLTTICSCLLIGLKSSGIFFIPFIIVVHGILFYKSKLNKNFKIPIIIFSLFVILWLIRSFLISGCFIYPVNFTCLNVEWFDIQILNYTIREINLYAFKPFKLSLVENFLSIKIFLFIFLSLIVTCSFFYLIKSNLNRINRFDNFILIFLSLIYIALIINFEDLRGFSTLVEKQKSFFLKNIILKEIFYILSIFIISFVITFWFSKKGIVDFNKKIFTSYFSYTFYYLVFLLSIWVFNAPHPRFAYGYIHLIMPMILILLFNFKENYKNKIFIIL